MLSASSSIIFNIPFFNSSSSFYYFTSTKISNNRFLNG